MTRDPYYQVGPTTVSNLSQELCKVVKWEIWWCREQFWPDKNRYWGGKPLRRAQVADHACVCLDYSCHEHMYGIWCFSIFFTEGLLNSCSAYRPMSRGGRGVRTNGDEGCRLPRKIRTPIKKSNFFFGNSGFQTPGLVPLDSSRNSVLFGGIYVSGTPIWTRVEHKSILRHRFSKTNIESMFQSCWYEKRTC